jgi:hypothetical protein
MRQENESLQLRQMIILDVTYGLQLIGGVSEMGCIYVAATPHVKYIVSSNLVILLATTR